VFHTVSRGETLGGIAGRYGVTVGAIVRANDNIEDPDVIYTGQRLIIPPPS
jgi:LysM repeat protein